MQIQDHVAFEQLSANGRLVSMIGGLLTQGIPVLERGSILRGSAYYVIIKLNHHMTETTSQVLGFRSQPTMHCYVAPCAPRAFVAPASF